MAIGPAIITASVVLGPGSILLNSKIGAEFGYDFIWLLVLTIVLMIGMTAISARLGIALDNTICEEVATRISRPIAIAIGVILFVVTGSFQCSNNLGVLFGLQPFVEGDAPAIDLPSWWPVALLVLVNGIVICALLFFRDLYRSVERLMKLLVAVMMFGFAANLFLARPSVYSIAGGLVPGLPENFTASSIVPVTGLMATTFSIAAAFYQAYLVRQKGWNKDDLNDGLTDTFVGIGMLGVMSLMVMLTAASVLHGSADQQWTSAADVAMQLRPFFGPFATILFCAGIFAGAFSSFLVNAMLGGTVMADAIGKGADVNGPWTRGLTIVLLLFGMFLAIAVRTAELDIGRLIMIAQAVTVLGNPFLAGTMLYLAYTPTVRQQNIIPRWVRVLGWIGFVVVLLLSVRTIFGLYVKLTAN